jgi:hypothetical protein
LASLVDGLRVEGKPITAQMQTIGTSTEFYSGNPKKPLGHHFDRRAPGASDMDIDLFSPPAK